MLVGCGHWLISFGNYAAIKAAGLIWAPTEFCIFVTTGQCVYVCVWDWGTSEDIRRTMEDVVEPAS